MIRQPEQQAFSQWLRQQRIQHGFTQAELADMLGVESKTIQRWEKGSQIPRPYLLPKLQKALGPLPEQVELDQCKQTSSEGMHSGREDQLRSAPTGGYGRDGRRFDREAFSSLEHEVAGSSITGWMGIPSSFL